MQKPLIFLPSFLLCLSQCSPEGRLPGPSHPLAATQIPAAPRAQGTQGDSP